MTGLVIAAEAEYIRGEREFFSKSAYRNTSYAKKALALMGSLFKGGPGEALYQAAARASFPDVVMTSSDWNLFDADPELETMQDRLATHFLNTMLGATDYAEKGRVFQGLDSATWFKNLYGVNRDPYTVSYARYVHDKGMPLWASSIEEDHEDYDYQAYAEISAAEGVELARAAMRYYTWGLEYALPVKGASVPVKGSEVYTENKTAITQWISGDASEDRRSSCYYPGSVSALDLATVPGASGLPSGWANGLNLDSPYAGGKSGSPLPYARGGVSSPRNFAASMAALYAGAKKPAYAQPPVGAGVDGLGLVTGALAMSGLYDAIDNLDNVKVAQNLALYFRTGDASAQPNRLTREDLEKSTLLITDLGQLRPGDLVLHYGSGEGQIPDPLRIAVVVYVPATKPSPGTDPSAFLNEVVVVGANEGNRQVSLETWAELRTSGKEVFHARRLVRIKPVVRSMATRETSRAQAAKRISRDEQNLLDVIESELTVTYDKSYEQTSPAGVDERYRWIPNTGEYLVIENIRVSAKNKAGRSFDVTLWLGYGNYEVTLGAEDRGYDASREAQGNIYNNQGTGFEIAALPPEGYKKAPSPVRVVDLYPRDHSMPDSMRYYSRSYTRSEFYDASGVWKGENYIGLERGIVTIWTAVYQTTRLGIRPLLGDIRPGDDILIRVGIRRLGARLVAKEASVGAKDYLAVYDKKMLWRANLYIDEGLTTDWNNKHPWNAPPDAAAYAAMSLADRAKIAWWSESWGYNKWNRMRNLFAQQPGWSSDGQLPAVWSRDNHENDYLNSAQSPLVGNGGQVIQYNTWTLFTNARNVSTAVAYGWGCADSPFEFDEEVLEQKSRIKTRRSLENAGGKKPTGYGALLWSDFMGAPEDNWDNYIFPQWHLVYTNTAHTRANFSYNGADPAATEPTNSTETQHIYTLPIGETVSVPGLSTFLYNFSGTGRSPGNENNEPGALEWGKLKNWINWRDDIPEQAKSSQYTSGIDCSGLAWRSIMYEGNTYSTNFNNRMSTTGFVADANTLQLHPGGWNIVNPDNLPKQEADRAMISRAVPGDLLVVGGSHVMIIQDLRYPEGSTVITEYTQVDLIHSTSGGSKNPTWQVQHNTWGLPIGDDYASYQLRRYK